MFLEGHVIEFLDSDQLKVGFVRKQEHDRLQIVDPRGRHISVGQDRVVVVHQRSSEDGFPVYARELSEKVLDRQAEVDIELLWQSVGGTSRGFTSAELAAIFFSEASSEATSAVFRTLSGDSLFFRRKGTQFQAKTVDQVETERTRRDREQEHGQLREHMTQSLKQLIRSKVSEPAADLTPILDRLQHWLRHSDGDPIGALLEELTSPVQARGTALDILVRAGRIDPRRDRFLVLAGIDEEFPPVAEAAAASLVSYAHGEGRVDYRDIPTVTIDDADTMEVDDAITLRREGTRFVVGIHIADVSWFVAKGDALDVEAAVRSSTIYLPANTVRMFPDRLATNLVSLQRGEDRPACTMEVEFDEHFNRIAHRLMRTSIRVDHRLTYDEANQRIADSEADLKNADMLKTLHTIALQLRQDRALRGAVTLRRPEFQIHVDDSGIHVARLDPDSPSQLLVTELMVLYNSLAADFAASHNLPVIYRTQEPRDSSTAIPADALDPISFDKLRKTFKRSRLSLTPGPHSGLGVSAYTQVSSPIRRYADTVTQQQFAAHLKGSPLPFTRDELTKILAGAETAEYEIRGIEERSTNYWILEYLAREKMGQPMNACVLDRKGSIELEVCYLRGKLPDPGNEEPGATLSVMIDSIHPVRGEVRFKRA